MIKVPATLVDLARLSALLERIDRSPGRPDPAQYRQLVGRINEELQHRAADPGLRELLASFPSTAELYENLQYGAAGLCLSPLERSVETEQMMRRVLQSLAGRPATPDAA